MIEYTVKVEDNGDTYWYLNGVRHREDGPAIELFNGDKTWYRNGKLHRVDGPAIECSDGYKEWWINGKRLTKEEFNRRTKKHTIVIDGKTIEISEESYRKMRNSLTS